MRSVLAAICLIPLGIVPALAEDAEFLDGLSGSWTGSGFARRSADGGPINVNCQFTTEASSASLALQGDCRALAVIRQTLSASLNNGNGTDYQGVYVGPQGGQSALAGARDGNTIDLAVTWAQPVNGDDQARMQVEVPDKNSMVLRTIDTSQSTGAEVVTSEITLTRQ